jgi:hypothetical protein
MGFLWQKAGMRGIEERRARGEDGERKTDVSNIAYHLLARSQPPTGRPQINIKRCTERQKTTKYQ